MIMIYIFADLNQKFAKVLLANNRYLRIFAFYHFLILNILLGELVWIVLSLASMIFNPKALSFGGKEKARTRTGA